MTARLYLAPDAYGDPTIWRDTGHDRDEAVLTRTGGNAAGFDALVNALAERDWLREQAATGVLKVSKVEAACVKAEALTQDAMGKVSEHWRGRDYADGLDAGIELTTALVREATR